MKHTKYQAEERQLKAKMSELLSQQRDQGASAAWTENAA